MRRNNQYILRTIGHIPYLIPIGQAVADRQKTHQLNSTGVYLWNLLRHETSFDELLSRCIEHFSIDNNYIEAFQHDIRGYINSLITKGLIISPVYIEDIIEPFYGCLTIAGMTCNLYGAEASFSHKFQPFLSENEAVGANQYIEVKYEDPTTRENGYCLLRNNELWVMECSDFYVLLFPTMDKIDEVRLSKDGTTARIYCPPPYDDAFRENLFHVIRHLFLVFAQLHGILALHSSSILYRDKAWLFTAPSQVGKSTQAHLWSRIQGSHIINGDMNLIEIKYGVPLVLGTPWCGTSEIFDTKTYPLGGIFILRQSRQDSIEKLTMDQKELLLCQRVISPVWTSKQLSYNMNICRELGRKSMVCRLHCTKEENSFVVTKQAIDFYLSSVMH